MSDQGCLDELRAAAMDDAGSPQKAAARVVKKFSKGASKAELRQLRTRLEDTLAAGKYTDVSALYLAQHNRWLAVLEGACATVRSRG
jgi:hypothetical protein